jgi:hypothetical protein
MLRGDCPGECRPDLGPADAAGEGETRARHGRSAQVFVLMRFALLSTDPCDGV